MSTATEHGYTPLTIDTAIQYAKGQSYFTQNEEVYGEEIGDGNLNLVFRLTGQDGQRLIIKQALPYAKVIGDSWPLTLDRARIESEVLTIYGTYVPELVPKVLHTDSVQALTVMEDLSHLQIARKALKKGDHFPVLGEAIGRYTAHTLFFTSDFGMNQQDKKQLQKRFCNPDLCKITEELFFTDPFYDVESNSIDEGLQAYVKEHIWNDQTLLFAVAKAKYQFLTKAEALLHGDLHTGSIFADETQTKVIDPEFAFFGPVGFDIGSFLGNLAIAHISQAGYATADDDRQTAKQSLQQQMMSVWKTFEDEYATLWQNHNVEPHASIPGWSEKHIEAIWKDAVRFAGCELIRRTIGLALVEDFESIADKDRKLAAKTAALRVGKHLLLSTNIHTSEAFVKAVVS
ncbi:S-methyl-5-thioribose kinase [Aureibacillus halotolerans]|uniref:S-methyl-5-thioribose kinase n=1 Tax=Aureibacillus halotolerans TaxID=1508390 RepID=A0A4R6U1D5_9BACI|nr:S-methyl-5-thioribose kinase [Aureibacillus halotolerans]TDQ39791.1 5'-methylthioribose kinase [Aureibacillus halotolerans]